MSLDHLVIITGAGASRQLGSENRDLPLMSEWATTLRKALDQRQFGLSDLVGIRHDQSGPDFEQAVGEFLQWQRSLALSARYLPLGIDIGQRRTGDVQEWQQRARFAADNVVLTLRATLYE